MLEVVSELEPLIKKIRQQQEATAQGVKGLTFDELLILLAEVDALNQFELTEKERLSVLST